MDSAVKDNRWIGAFGYTAVAAFLTTAIDMYSRNRKAGGRIACNNDFGVGRELSLKIFKKLNMICIEVIGVKPGRICTAI